LSLEQCVVVVVAEVLFASKVSPTVASLNHLMMLILPATRHEKFYQQPREKTVCRPISRTITIDFCGKKLPVTIDKAHPCRYRLQDLAEEQSGKIFMHLCWSWSKRTKKTYIEN